MKWLSIKSLPIIFLLFLISNYVKKLGILSAETFAEKKLD